MERVISFIGLLTMLAIAWLLSTDRKKINWKTVGIGVGLQLFLGLIILKTEIGLVTFEWAKNFFTSVLNFTNEGSRFVFGGLMDANKVGFVFATMVLPTIIFISSLMAIGYHLGVMQKVVEWTARIMMKLMGTSGSESLASAANIFAGQTEAPLVIRPYIDKMTKSELLALMTGGMATVAGGVLAAYVGLGIDAGHLLAASVMSAPAALVCAKILMPETELSQTAGISHISIPRDTTNIIDAAAKGAAEGLKLALNVAAMLLAFIALIALVNAALGMLGSLIGIPELSFEMIMGYVFAPIAFILGVPWSESHAVGVFLGKKLVLNEFVAYLDLKDQLDELSPRAVVIATYALCGFANFSSIAIQLGGIGTIAPNRRQHLAELGIKSLIGGTLACLMTAAIAGLFI